MGILDQLKKEKVDANKKRPYTPSLSTKIAYIIDQHNSDMGLPEEDDSFYELRWKSLEIVKKNEISVPPIYLSSKNAYDVAKEMVTRFNNPYVEYCTTVDELLVSRQLYNLNPNVEPRWLREFDFITLVDYELSRKTVSHAIAEKNSLNEILEHPSFFRYIKFKLKKLFGRNIQEKDRVKYLSKMIKEINSFIDEVESGV